MSAHLREAWGRLVKAQVQIQQGSPLDYGHPITHRFFISGEVADSTHPYFRELDRDVVAFADVWDKGSEVYLGYITVRPDQQGKGYARELMQFIYDYFPGKGVDWGRIMDDSIAHLYQDFRERYPDRGTWGKIRGSMARRVIASGPYYHGTNVAFTPGSILVGRSGSGAIKTHDYAETSEDSVFFSDEPFNALTFAVQRAEKQGGIPHVYEVRALDIQPDPEQASGFGMDQWVSSSATVVRELSWDEAMEGWLEGRRGKSIQERLRVFSSMGPYPEMPMGFSLDPPLYRSGLHIGDRVIITHPDLGGAEVEGIVTGEIPVSGILMVRLVEVDALVQVPLSMVREAASNAQIVDAVLDLPVDIARGLWWPGFDFDLAFALDDRYVVRESQYPAIRKEITERSQAKLRQKGYGPTIRVLRSGPIDLDMPVATTLDRGTADFFKGQTVEYEVDLEDVLYYVGAFTTGSFRGEEEVGVMGRDLRPVQVLREAALTDDDLKAIRLEYENHHPDEYGSWACFDVAPRIEKQWGYRAVEGFYAPEGDVNKALDSERLYTHWWNVMPDGRILDATAGQWKRGDGNVEVVSGNDPRYIEWKDIPVARRDEALDLTSWSLFTGSKTAVVPVEFIDERMAVTASELSWEGLISVAEQTMERAGQVGRRWSLPDPTDFSFESETGRQHGRYNPEYKALILPLEQFVAQVTGDPWYIGNGSVGYKAWDLREAGNPLAMVDGMGNISLQLQTNDMTILHECAHVIQRTREGEGHDEDFARLLRDLYARYISQEAADTFWGIIEMTGRVASTWRGFQEGEPFWKSADAVIATQRRGRERYFETWINGRNYGNFPRLDDAKAHIEQTYGSLDWRQVSMPLVEVEHYYFGPTTEFTDPLTIYVADF